MTRTQEAILDSRFLAYTADLGVKKVTGLKLDGGGIELDDFIAKLVTRMGGRRSTVRGVTDAGLYHEGSWRGLGKLSAPYMFRLPTSDYMFV